MNILVIGCDQVGASLVRDLEHIGHDISLIEKDPEQLKRLDAFDDYRFRGTALVGDPTDPDTLRQGGIDNCDAVAAVSEDDSVNLMAAQIAKSIFRRGKGHLPRVRPASAGAVPQGLRDRHHLPHRAHRAIGVPRTGKVKAREAYESLYCRRRQGGHVSGPEPAGPPPQSDHHRAAGDALPHAGGFAGYPGDLRRCHQL